jgi:hypothetical protein
MLRTLSVVFVLGRSQMISRECVTEALNSVVRSGRAHKTSQEDRSYHDLDLSVSWMNLREPCRHLNTPNRQVSTIYSSRAALSITEMLVNVWDIMLFSLHGE